MSLHPRGACERCRVSFPFSGRLRAFSRNPSNGSENHDAAVLSATSAVHGPDSQRPDEVHTRHQNHHQQTQADATEGVCISNQELDQSMRSTAKTTFCICGHLWTLL